VLLAARASFCLVATPVRQGGVGGTVLDPSTPSVERLVTLTTLSDSRFDSCSDAKHEDAARVGNAFVKRRSGGHDIKSRRVSDQLILTLYSKAYQVSAQVQF